MAALALVTAGCASSGSGSDQDAAQVSEFGELRDGMVNVDASSGDPVDGGEASFAAYSEPRSLDPAKTVAAVTTGGVEMLNIYDSLMRYDTDTQSVVPQMAKELSVDDSYETWTLTLRDGVTFSDGTPVDSAAVKTSQERYAAAPAPEAALWNDNVVEIATPDATTVVYTLNKTWPEFSSMLASGPGMIVAESAGAPDGDFQPVGAGPFTLDSWNNTEFMTLAAHDDYWNGKPPLDSLKFVYMPTMQVSMETFFNGGVDMAFVREPDDVNEMLDRNTAGYVNLTAASNAAIINALPGRPGSDPRVREAMQLAIDPGVLNQRAYDNAEFGESEMFAEYSRWHSDAAAPTQDLEKAKSLVEEAKADGFDGKIVTINAPDQAKQQQAVAIEAQLNAVGFDVDTKNMPTIGDQIRVIAAEQDYDLGAWGINFRDSDPFPKMFEAMHSGGKQLYGMYTSAEMDELIDQFQVETDEDEKLNVMADIQRQVNKDVPFLVYGYYAEFIAWQDDIHGVKGSANSMVLFDEAWKS